MTMANSACSRARAHALTRSFSNAHAHAHSNVGASPRRAPLLLAAPLLLLAALTSRGAFAQTDKEKAASDKLYQEGLSKMLEGKLDVGCPKLAESQRLFPRPGTLFTLAECEAKAGRLATAIERYQEYLKLFSEMDPDQQKKQREKQRDDISATQIIALTKQAPRIRLTVVGGTKNLSVTLDGAAVDPARFDEDILVDPGEHVVRAEGGEGGPFERSLTLAKGASERVEIKGVKAAKADKGSSNASSGPSGRRVAAYVVGGAGVVILGVGAVTGVLALGDKDTVTAHCKDTRKNDVWSCDATGLRAAESGQTLATVSSITLGVGLGAAATGLVLFLTEPSAKKKKKQEDAAARWVSPQVFVAPSGGFAGAVGVW